MPRSIPKKKETGMVKDCRHENLDFDTGGDTAVCEDCHAILRCMDGDDCEERGEWAPLDDVPLKDLT